ncbi:MAG TPA: SPOCS domain-containing protein [Bacillota bacterium]|nr:SPOCS domain-containing protein [Bacillota bacterium]
MAIECMRDLLKLDQVVGEDISQALVEGDVNIPDTKAPVSRILDITSQAVISSKEVIQDKVMVEGVLHYDILYVTEGDGEIDAVEAEIGFTQYLDMPGARPKMLSCLDLTVEHLDYEIVSGRKLNVKAVLNLYGKVSETLELESVRDFGGVSDVEVLRDRIEASSSAGEGRTQTMLREDLELSDSMPSIQRILRRNIRVRINEQSAMDNKVRVTGMAEIKLLYQSDDEEDPVHFINHEIEFAHSVEIPGAYQGMDSRANAGNIEFYADPREDINGEFRIIDTEAVINLEASVYEPLELDIISDAYSPSVPMTLKKKGIVLSQFAGEAKDQTVVKESLAFPADIPKARKILYVDVSPHIASEIIGDGQVTIEGILLAKIVYQSKDPDLLVGSFSQDIPFSHTLELEGADSSLTCTSEINTDHIGHVLLAQDEAEIKAALSISVTLSKKIEKEVIIGAEELEQSEAVESGIYIYFVQPGDNLWSVAKKYNTTTSLIMGFNQLEDDGKLTPGSKLVIYKKLDIPAV